MADDLDAFFDEVSAAEAEVTQEEGEDHVVTKDEDDVAPPPAKKAKTAPKRPLGVVVAAASSAPTTSNKQATATTESTATPAAVVPSVSLPAPTFPVATQQPPLPPGPPPPPTTATTSKKAHIYRTAAGKTWVDPTMAEWPENDYRIFVGNLSKDVTDQQLYDHFAKYPSLAMVKIVKDKMGVSKEYGFVSFLQPLECAKAMREMDQTWLGIRPIRTKKCDWKDRDLKQAKKKRKGKR